MPVHHEQERQLFNAEGPSEYLRCGFMEVVPTFSQADNGAESQRQLAHQLAVKSSGENIGQLKLASPGNFAAT